MRIIGGIAAGRILTVPKGQGVRPTPDKVRQAIFNSLGERVVDALILELFAGTGALSLECLSRGARSAVCVEKSSKHAKFIRSNLRSTGMLRTNCNVIVNDAFAAITSLRTQSTVFDLIFADPPFGEKNVGWRSESFSQKLLDDLNLPHLLKPCGLLVLGHAKRDQLDIPERWVERKSLEHGDSTFRMLVPAEPTQEQPLLGPTA